MITTDGREIRELWHVPSGSRLFGGERNNIEEYLFVPKYIQGYNELYVHKMIKYIDEEYIVLCNLLNKKVYVFSKNKYLYSFSENIGEYTPSDDGVTINKNDNTIILKTKDGLTLRRLSDGIKIKTITDIGITGIGKGNIYYSGYLFGRNSYSESESTGYSNNVLCVDIANNTSVDMLNYLSRGNYNVSLSAVAGHLENNDFIYLKKDDTGAYYLGVFNAKDKTLKNEYRYPYGISSPIRDFRLANNIITLVYSDNSISIIEYSQNTFKLLKTISLWGNSYKVTSAYSDGTYVLADIKKAVNDYTTSASQATLIHDGTSYIYAENASGTTFIKYMSDKLKKYVTAIYSDKYVSMNNVNYFQPVIIRYADLESVATVNMFPNF